MLLLLILATISTISTSLETDAGFPYLEVNQDSSNGRNVGDSSNGRTTGDSSDKQTIGDSSNHQIHEAYYKTLLSGYSYDYLRTYSTDQFFTTRNLIGCSSLSLRSQSEFFSYNKASHICKNYSPKNIIKAVNTQDMNEISYYRSSEWIKVYAISMGANSLIYNSLINEGDPATWNVDKCSNSYCPNFFRNPLLDVWTHLSIEEVKLMLFENETSVVTMVFDGQNTNITNWFSVENLKSSPWNDLARGQAKIFSLVGINNVRRFYISSSQVDCVIEQGWLTINEASIGCLWEKSNHFPAILYSKTNSKIRKASDYGVADSMAIFIRLRQN